MSTNPATGADLTHSETPLRTVETHGARVVTTGAASARSHSHRIELKLHDLNQLFNSMDPSPFIEKDLDADAEEFIVSWAHEFPLGEPLELRVYLQQWPTDDARALVPHAIHNYFAHRAELTQLEFSRLMKQGRTSLLIGIAFLVGCLLLGKTVLGGVTGAWASVPSESLTIAGWVAMWRPMQIYLYDWWPLKRRARVYKKLSRMPVEVGSQPKT